MVTKIFFIVFDVLLGVLLFLFVFFYEFQQFLQFLLVELFPVDHIVEIITVFPQETTDGCFGNHGLFVYGFSSCPTISSPKLWGWVVKWRFSQCHTSSKNQPMYIPQRPKMLRYTMSTMRMTSIAQSTMHWMSLPLRAVPLNRCPKAEVMSLMSCSISAVIGLVVLCPVCSSAERSAHGSCPVRSDAGRVAMRSCPVSKAAEGLEGASEPVGECL